MPYLTPETLPLTHECRRLLIPDSPEWLAIVSGALTELTLKWNWQQQGITVDEALQAAYAIVNSYYDQPCTDPDACTTEEETRIIRLVPGGEWQELINGTWQTPEGDYEIEPTPARSEPSELDRLCLASKNSVNALKALYEEVTDAFDEFGAIEPVVAALLAGIGVVVAAFVSVAAAAFVALGAFAIEQFFQLLGSISYDLWNEEFEEVLYCIFLDNASNEDDVTHFDYDAIVAALNEEMNGVNLDFQRKQLALQVLYLLSIIGKPGIEWAGTTTAITDDDCSDCQITGAWEFYPDASWSGAHRGACTTGAWVGTNRTSGTPLSTEVMTRVQFEEEIALERVSVTFTKTNGTFSPAASYSDLMIVNSGNGWYNGLQLAAVQSDTNASGTWTWTGTQLATLLTIWMFSSGRNSGGTNGSVSISHIEIEGDFGLIEWDACD